MTKLPLITQFSGEVPDKTKMDKDTFANSVYNYLNYFNNTFVPDTQDFTDKMNTLADEIQTTADNTTTSENNAKNYELLAKDYANADKNVEVESGFYSAKHWSLVSQDQANIAAANANFKGEWSNLSGSLSVPASVAHKGKIWILLNNLDDVTQSEPGVSNDWFNVNEIHLTDIAPDGASEGQIIQFNGSEWALANLPQGIVSDYQEFTSSGTWTKPTGAKWIYVECIGAGGGGANNTGDDTTVGGGGGGFTSMLLKASDIDDNISVVIGAGGSGGSSGGNNDGGDGGDSSFGNYVVGRGGKGGCKNYYAIVNSPYPGSSGSGATISYYNSSYLIAGGGFAGGSGGGGYCSGGCAVKGGGGGGGAYKTYSGSGGISQYAGNGGDGNANSNTKAGNGSFPGGGGGASTQDGGGGDGADGIVRVWAW